LTTAVERRRGIQLHPVHAVLLAGALPLFLGTLLSDWAYGATYEVQWTNFASWLLAGALLLGGFALLWSLIDLLRADRRGRRPIAAFLLLLATWVLGFINALVHSKDAWATMPEGLILSIIVTSLAVAATWSAFAGVRSGAVQ
jgi:uncharacterized membrane protein